MEHKDTLMNPMTLEQYNEIVKFVQEHHPFRSISNPKYEKMWIKYIDSNYDTRQGVVWAVSFRGMIPNIRFATNSMASFEKVPYKNLYDCVMAFLKGEYTDISEYFIKE